MIGRFFDRCPEPIGWLILAPLMFATVLGRGLKGAIKELL